jgi:cell shape-determining protein MreC
MKKITQKLAEELKKTKEENEELKKTKEENEELKNKLNELYEYCDNYCEGERLYEYSDKKGGC